MKLQSFGISNFKAFGHTIQRMSLKPITLIFGPNSAGKSSLLQSFFWTLKSAASGDLENRTADAASGSIDLGGFRTLLHRHEKERRIQVEISIESEPGKEPVRIIHQLGLPMSQDFRRMEDHLIAKSPITKSYREQLKICENSRQAFAELFNFHDIPPQEQIEALLKDPVALQERIESSAAEAANQGYLPFEGNTPDLKKLRKTFTAGSKAWKKIQELQVHKDEIRLHEEKVRGILIQEMHDASLLAVEVFRGNDSALKAVRLPGQKTLECQLLDSSVVENLPEPQNMSLNMMVVDFAGRRPIKTLFDGYDVVIPKNGDFKAIPNRILAIAMGWLEISLEAARTSNSNLIYLGPLRHLPGRKELLGISGEQSHDPSLMPWIRLRDNPQIRNSVNKALADLQSQPCEFRTRVYAQGREVLEARSEFEVFGYTRKDDQSPLWLDAEKDVWGSPPDIQDFDSQLLEDEEGACNRLDEVLLDRYATAVMVDLGIHDLRHGINVSLRDVGVGISQIAPILVHAHANENKLIAIEQPEIHIHPKLQAELGDVFIESALGERKNSFLIETHSEHLILRILRRIRETTDKEFSDWSDELKKTCPNGIRPEDVAVLYVEPGEDGAKVIELPVTLDGDFSRPWPDGFFSERSKELF